MFNMKNLIIMITILIAVLLFVKIIDMINKIRCDCREVKLEKYNIELNTEIDLNVPALLDGLIGESFSNYLLLNVEYNNIKYINAKQEAKIRKELVQRVSNQLSPILITKLSAYYNVSAVGQIIAEKVYKVVLDYTISKNKPS